MPTAQDIAAELGREWTECGAYERMAFEEEAQRRLQWVNCEACGGSGEIIKRDAVGAYDDPAAAEYAVTCFACDGTGRDCQPE